MYKKLILVIILICTVAQQVQTSMVPVNHSVMSRVGRIVNLLKQNIAKHKYICASVLIGAIVYKQRSTVKNIFRRIFENIRAKFSRHRDIPSVIPGQQFLPIDQYPTTALFDAIEHNNIELLQHLLPYRNEEMPHILPIRSRFRSSNDLNNTLLARAIELGNADAVRILLDAGFNLYNMNLELHTALHVASRYGRRNIIHMLLHYHRKTDINYNLRTTALHVATEYGHLGCVEELLAAGADVNVRKHATHRTPLYLAAQNGYSRIVEILARAGSNIDPTIDLTIDKPYPGEGPLHTAASNRHWDTVRTLIQYGADINARDDRGRLFDQVSDDPQVRQFRPLTDQLFEAIQRGNYDGATHLIQQGASSLALSAEGTTPLHEAIGDYQDIPTAHDRIARFMIRLLGRRATQVRDTHGSTPLHRAVQFNNLRLAIMLLRAGADAILQDNDGKTPIDFARNKVMLNVLARRV